MEHDLQCTWWPDVWFGHSIQHCCVAHDIGGTDMELARCVVDTSPWLLPVAAIMIVGLVVGRPVYRQISKRQRR